MPFVRVAAVVVLALSSFVTACPKAGTDPAATTATAAPSPPWWMSLHDGKLHRGLDEAPVGLYAAGVKEGATFVPGGEIEGDGAFDAAGEPGFLDLTTGTFVAASAGPPKPPYVEGAMTSSGFVPRSRKVVY